MASANDGALHALIGAEARSTAGRLDLAAFDGARVLITGATGLIGSNLVEVLRLSGAAFTLLERGGSRSGKFNYIIHAAGYAQPSKFLADPLGTAEINTTKLMELLKCLKPSGRLIFLSSSEVYNGHPRGLYTEADAGSVSFSHPRAVYIHSKLCGEAICKESRNSGVDAVVARVCSVYGPGVRLGDTRVMSEFITQAIKNDEIAPKDGGSDRRTFCYVGDAVEMILNILMRGTNGVYNVGGVGETSILGLARKIGEIMRVPVKSPYKTYRAQASEGAPAHASLDLSRYQREFGEKTFVPIDDGLKRTVAWHRALHGERVAA